MGIDKGFDLYPPLTESEVDKGKWAAFLDEVKQNYKHDDNMTITERGTIIFTLGEHPRLMKDGNRFRRFSAKISGRLCGNVELYLDEVTNIAKQHFGERVHPWSELNYDPSENVCYDWNEVYEAGYLKS